MDIKARVGKLLLEEAGGPLNWYWLSFADPDLPTGKQFRLAGDTGLFFIVDDVIARCDGGDPGDEQRKGAT